MTAPGNARSDGSITRRSPTTTTVSGCGAKISCATRVAVAASQRRRGIGAQLYDAMEVAAASFERMVCEVNVLPPNHASLAFHAARGYVEVGRLAHGPAKLVALLSKELATDPLTR